MSPSLCYSIFLFVATLLCSQVATYAARYFAGVPVDSLEMVYHIWDLGDGHWVPGYRGEGRYPAALDIPLDVAVPERATWTAVGLSGAIHGTGKVARVEPGESSDTSLILDSLVAWSGAGAAFEAGDNEVFLDSIAAVEWLVLKSKEGHAFPRHIRVQSTLSLQGDDGPWYEIPSAVFPFLPEPHGNELWIPLNGLAVKGLKVVIPSEQGDQPWAIGALEIRGSEDLPWQASGLDEHASAIWWNMWLTFGVAKNQVHKRFDPWWETNRPIDGGMVCIGSCEWLYWGAKKLSWLGPDREAERLEAFIAGNPVDEDGMVWAAPNSPKHLGHSVHYVNNSIYPMAVAHHYLMQRDPAFLERKDPRTGEAILSKARRAMGYALNELRGSEGLLVFDDPETNGAAGSHGSNYWDFWLFGHLSAYANAFFYESLGRFAELEAALGNSEKARDYRDLRESVKIRFNNTFWNEKTGRYVGWIDVNGKTHDYGLTFVNQMVLGLGLADSDKAALVLEWLDGERMVEGDDSQGKDIFDAFGFAARANTVDARHAQDAINTWNGALSVEPDGNAAFGEQIQNGGTIFYTSYYDLHGRKNYADTANLSDRWMAIAAEFEKDQLNRDPANNHGNSDIVGILREFPESGLVPYFFVDGLFGMLPVAEGLIFEPALLRNQDRLFLKGLHFNDREFEVSVDRSLSRGVLEGNRLKMPAEGRWLLTLDGKVEEK